QIGNVTITVNNVNLVNNNVKTTQNVSMPAAIHQDGTFSAGFNTSTWLANPSGYQVTFHYTGDNNFNAPNDATSPQLLIVNRATLNYSSLKVPQTTYGGSSTISGTLSYPLPHGIWGPVGNVSITVNGLPQQTPTIDSSGNFSVAYPTYPLNANTNP